MALSGTPTFGGIGIVEIDGNKVRCNDCSVNVVQNPEFYDHTIGLVDTLKTNLDTKGEQSTPYTLNYQKLIWRPGVSVVSGGVSFPASQGTFSNIFGLARKGTIFTIKVYYDCGISRTYENCRINTASFSVDAGDLLKCTIDVMGTKATESTTASTGPLYSTVQKLITWDIVDVNPQISSTSSGTTTYTTFSPLNGMQSFELSINNSCIPIYTQKSMSSEKYMPVKIRIGMQEINGNIVFYTKGKDYNYLSGTTTEGKITFKVGTFFTQDIAVVYRPVERNATPGVLSYTLPFFGVGRPLGS